MHAGTDRRQTSRQWSSQTRGLARCFAAAMHVPHCSLSRVLLACLSWWLCCLVTLGREPAGDDGRAGVDCVLRREGESRQSDEANRGAAGQQRARRRHAHGGGKTHAERGRQALNTRCSRDTESASVRAERGRRRTHSLSCCSLSSLLASLLSSPLFPSAWPLSLNFLFSPSLSAASLWLQLVCLPPPPCLQLCACGQRARHVGRSGLICAGLCRSLCWLQSASLSFS